MRSPSIKRLQATFDLDTAQAERIKALCALADDREGLREFVADHCPETDRYARSCYNDPFRGGMWRRTMVLHAIDCIVGGCGVECAGEDMPPPFEYINFGDSYVSTLVYRRATDNLTIGCAGGLD